MRPTFREQLSDRAPVFGAFVKSPAWQGVELIGMAGYNFVVIDEEHAPFNRETVDILILAARAAGIAPLVRVPGVDGILQALDGGAKGVMVPHISSVDRACAAVEAFYYGIGRRGYSPSGRAGNYGTAKRSEHIAGQDSGNALVAMIEDPEALPLIDAICAVEGITALFIGRGDLTVAMGAEGPDAPELIAAVDTILAGARKAGLPVMMNVACPEEAEAFANQGASAFIIGSDQSFLKSAARQTLLGYHAVRPTT